MFLPLSIESRHQLKPPAALITIIALNIWFLALMTAIFTFNWMGVEDFLGWFAFDPFKPTLLGIILSMFTHAGWMHLLGNMFFLWVFGWILEDRIGWKKFTLIYLGCGIAGSLIEMGIYWAAANGQAESEPSIGASGCVMAVMGVTLTRYFNLKVRVVNPFILPLIVWFLLMIFMPRWRQWLASYLILYLPLAYTLPLTARKLVYRVPLWVFAVYSFVGDYAMVIKGENDGINHIVHAFCFLTGLGAGWLMYLPQENLDDRLLERAREDARQGFTNAALSEYEDYLRRYPEDGDARCELADFHLQQEEKNRFFGMGHRVKAILNYQKALGLWLAQGRELDAVKLYRSLRGTIREEEWKPELVAMVMKLGEKDKVLSMKAPDRRAALEEEIKLLYGNRQYLTAYPALMEWWKLGNLRDSNLSFLTLAGDLCHRQQDNVKEDLILEFLAENGNDIQAARALHLLYKRWLGTPKQLHLKVIFKHALERVPELKLSHDLVELEGNLK